MPPDKKLHTPVGVPSSGLLTSLRRCFPPATTRRGGRRGKKEGGREKEREREKREGRKWDIGLCVLNRIPSLLEKVGKAKITVKQVIT